MKTDSKPIRSLIWAIALVLPSSAFGGTYLLSSGESLSGELVKLFEGTVEVQVAGQSVEHPLSAFDAASQQAISSWAEKNPYLVDVYSKWDSQPVIKSSSMPDIPASLNNGSFSGMVAVDLVLDEKGRVIHAIASKSTHAELEGPSVAAASTWVFAPAKIGGKAVKSRLRIPFKFTGK